MKSKLNLNEPGYPVIEEDPSDSEAHAESVDESIKSNVKGYEHPLFSANGVIQVVNYHRQFSNTQEENLSGKIQEKVFIDIAKAASKTKVPYDLLMFCCDWDNDLTSRGSASDAQSIASKLVSSATSLKSSLGRDPTNAEMFIYHVTQSAGKVKEIYENAQNTPEEEAKPLGTQKDDILLFKKRGQKTQKRKNRELYDYFYRRVPRGKVHFKKFLGQDKNAQA